VLIAAIWFAGVRQRAAVSSVVERQAAETRRLLAEMNAQLTDLNRRTADIQRILKDAE
jgi:hypothetical protein